MLTSSKMTVALFVIALSATIALNAITVVASPESVVWSGASGGCVYLIEQPSNARYRIGCSYSNRLDLDTGVLWEGDLVEVRRPVPSGVLTGRAIVGP